MPSDRKQNTSPGAMVPANKHLRGQIDISTRSCSKEPRTYTALGILPPYMSNFVKWTCNVVNEYLTGTSMFMADQSCRYHHYEISIT
jgi:hypothetical protein